MSRQGWRGLGLGVLAGLWLALAPAAAGAAGEGDWNRQDDPLLEGIGLHAGKIGGTGLAFKFPLQWWLYGQAAGGIWHTGDNRRHNFGLSLQYLLRQSGTMRVFLSTGLGYYYHREKLDFADAPDRYTVHDTWNTGFGVGLEMLRKERLSLQIEGDFTHESDDGSFLFFPQVGVFYYF